MGTTDSIGRWGGARTGEGTAEPSTLDRARKLFADLSCGLEGEIDRLQFVLETETEAGRIKALDELIRLNQKTLQTVLSLEARLESESQKPRPGRDVIDLAEARAEIARRLARLAE